jgi:hypothetical protein
MCGRRCLFFQNQMVGHIWSPASFLSSRENSKESSHVCGVLEKSFPPKPAANPWHSWVLLSAKNSSVALVMSGLFRLFVKNSKWRDYGLLILFSLFKKTGQIKAICAARSLSLSK